MSLFTQINIQLARRSTRIAPTFNPSDIARTTQVTVPKSWSIHTHCDNVAPHAAEFAEKLHVDEDAVLEMPDHDEIAIAKLDTPKNDERPPLGEIAPNSGSGYEDEVADMKKSTKGRKTAKKGTKGGKKDKAASANIQAEVEEEEVMPVVEDAAEEAFNDEPSDEPIDSDAPTAITGTTQPEEIPSQETLPLRMTRSQVALAQEQQTLPETNEEADDKDEQEAVEQPSLHIDIQQAEETSPAPAPASPLATATPKVIASLRKDTSGMRSTSNKENEGPSEASISVPVRDASLTPSRSTSNYDALEAAVVEAATPPSVSRRASAAEVHAVESQQVETSLRLEHVNMQLAEQSADAPIESPAPAGQEALVPENEEAPFKVVTVEPQPVETSPEAENIDTLLSEQPADTPIESPTQIGQEAPLSARKDTQQPQMISDPPAATDALKDALEQVASEASQVDAPAEKPKPKAKKPAPVVRTTKASAARMSLAKGDKAGAAKASSSARPRPSTARQSTVSKPVAERSQRVPSIGTQKPASEKNEKPTQQKKEATIPHSKPRPVNLSFPTPPPPPKSKKAPTTSTFQLPGEAVAAKLKAAREERMKKEAEQPQEKKPSVFKPRPAPPALKKTSSVIRQTTSTKARESMVNAKPTGSALPSAGLKRASTVTAGSTSGTTRPRAAVPPRTTAKPEDKSLKVAKRPTTTTSAAAGPTSSSRASSLTTTTTTTRTSSAPRPSTAGRPVPAPTSSAPTAPAAQQQQQHRILSKGTAKGKEVFSRALLAKEAAGKEKREKEEAARKAREVAAERGRLASREWAEKQKGRKVGNGGKRGDGGSGSGSGSGSGKAVVPAATAAVASEALGQGMQGTEGAAVLAQGAEEVAVPAGAEAEGDGVCFLLSVGARSGVVCFSLEWLVGRLVVFPKRADVISLKPVEELRGEVAYDDTRSGTKDALGSLERHGLQIEDAGFGRSVDHSIFTADVIRGDGHVAADFLRVGDDVEVLRRGLDHDDVRTFANLVASPVPEAGDGARCVAEWTVQTPGELGRVRHQDYFVRDPGFDQLEFDRADAAVVHIGRCHAVCAGFGVGDCYV
ncbi:Delta-aminolevulinic acid [Hortaea werneckii]|nr:Delta-aminolevulinic acid [Hortaea werneckii]